jgi:hypothetical protein
MADTRDELEALFYAPSANIGPTSPRQELLAAADILRRAGGYLNGQLCLWLADTALIHGPDDDGRHCHRDGDTWPCHDVQAAQKAALAVRLTAPEDSRG